MTVKIDTKELNHWTKSSIAAAVGCILAMTIGSFAYSWSQNHTYNFDFLLYGALLPIVLIFMIKSFAHPDKEKRLFWIVKQKAMSRIVAVLFTLVLMFGVNSALGWVSGTHVIATLLAILSADAFMILAQRNKVDRTAAILSSMVTLGIFALSYFGDDLTIAQGEAIKALPIVIWILRTTKK